MRILIATDAWHPQVNGVVRTLTSLARSAQTLGVSIDFLSPDGFRTVPVPTYPGLRLALPSRGQIARRIEQISEDALQINQGTIYLCLIRLVQKGWVDASWGTSENNRKAKFYAISKAGRKQLAAETKNWERVAGVIGRVLDLSKS